MQILKIKLTNVRCFEHFEVDLRSENGVKQWMIVLGDNGVGKTTILRSIALGLCEESGAAGLCAEVPGDWIRSGCDSGTIRIDILPYEGYVGEAYVETTFIRSDYKEVKLKQKTYPKEDKNFEWEALFVCAYGAASSVYGSADVSEYAVTDSVYSLFNYKSELQNPELVLRRLNGEENNGMATVLRKLEAVLMIEPNSVSLSRSGIMVNGPWGKEMAIGSLGDGYKSTITWLLDLYGWRLLAVDYGADFELEGIVIIDEMEKHLHPRWQKQLVGILSQQFPKLQFITSTHSPLCVIGTTELTDDACCITVSRQGSNSVETRVAAPPRGKRADQVLTSYLFELYTTGDESIKRDLGRYQYLFNKADKSPDEAAEENNLFNSLNETLGSAETELEEKVGTVLKRSIDMLFHDQIEEVATKSPEKFELIRQLRDLI